MKMDVNFGHVAKNYAQYRNDLPDELLKSLTLRGISFEGKKVVDLGCGTGVLSRALQKEGANVVGVEPALALIEEALTIDAKKGYRIDYQHGFSEDTSLRTDAYEIVTVLRAWHWFNREKTLIEIQRILQAHGSLIIVDSGFLSHQPIVDDTLHFIRKRMPSGQLKRAGAKATSSQLINSFPVEWFEEWQHAQFDLQETYKFYYDVHFSNEEWCGRVGSLSWLTDFDEKERNDLLEQLYRYIQKKYGHVQHQIRHGCYVAVLKRLAE